METVAGFVPVGEVSADEEYRVALATGGVRRDDRYAVAVNAEGEILLRPLATIRRRELIVWQDERVRAALVRSLGQSVSGDLVEAGDFTRFAAEEIDMDAAEA